MLDEDTHYIEFCLSNLNGMLDKIKRKKANGEPYLWDIVCASGTFDKLVFTAGKKEAINQMLKCEDAGFDDKQWKECYLGARDAYDTYDEMDGAYRLAYGAYTCMQLEYIEENHPDCVPTEDEIDEYHEKVMKDKPKEFPDEDEWYTCTDMEVDE